MGIGAIAIGAITIIVITAVAGTTTIVMLELKSEKVKRREGSKV